MNEYPIIDGDESEDTIITGDEPEPTKEEVVRKAQALLGEMSAWRDEYDRLTSDEKAQMPESLRRFFGA